MTLTLELTIFPEFLFNSGVVADIAFKRAEHEFDGFCSQILKEAYP